MSDSVFHRRKQTILGVTTTVDVFRCSYCGHSVTGSAPSYTEDNGTPNGTGGAFACRARGGSFAHATF